MVSYTGFDSKVKNHKQDLLKKVGELQNLDATIEAVLLVAARIQKNGQAWMTPKMVGWLYTPGNDTWTMIAGSSVKVRGKASPAKKPSLQMVWNQMEWETHPETQEKMGYLKHFLKAIGLPFLALEGRAKTFNKMLRNAGREERLERVSLPNKAGSEPWLGRKSLFRFLYTKL